MSRAPTGTLTKRIFHNIDFAWFQPNMCICTTIKSYQNMADEAINNIIPETLHLYGPAAGKWFTASALAMYENIEWDPQKQTTTTHVTSDTAKILDKDLWGLAGIWKALPGSSSDSTTPAVSNMSAVSIAIDRLNLTSAGDIGSLGSLYGRNKDADTVVTEATVVQPLAALPKDTQIEFDPNALPGHEGKPQESDGMSMSTAAQTTGTTRI
jgi:hypothetical protein